MLSQKAYLLLRIQVAWEITFAYGRCMYDDSETRYNRDTVITYLFYDYILNFRNRLIGAILSQYSFLMSIDWIYFLFLLSIVCHYCLVWLWRWWMVEVGWVVQTISQLYRKLHSVHTFSSQFKMFCLKKIKMPILLCFTFVW